MFVRWRYEGGAFVWRDRARCYEANGGHLFSLELVETHRVDGKPRQRVVSYLGHVNTHRLEDPALGEQLRDAFWEKLLARLQRAQSAGRVDSDTYRGLVDELETAIPRDAGEPLALPESARSAIRRGNTASRRAWAETQICNEHHLRRQTMHDLEYVAKHAPELLVQPMRRDGASMRQAKQLARLRRCETPAS